jgi:hypothetical protein
MAEKDIANTSEVIDGTKLKIVPLPRLRLPLASVRDCRREMGRVYRDMRANRLDKADGTKLAYVLSQLGKMLELDELEERVLALEQLSEEGKP